jgi:hypothetical protein
MSGPFTSIFQIGPRITASILGSPYAQYRPSGANNPTASGNLLRSIPVWITGDKQGEGTIPFTPAKPIAFGMFDAALTQVGDYLIGDFGTFFISSQDVPMPMQLVSCNQTVSLSRPGSPQPGANFYGGAATAALTPLMAGWPAALLKGTKGDKGEVQLPGDTRLAWADIMLPATSGVEILPGDWITTAQGTPMIYTISSCEITALGWRLSASSAVA